jgi:hypothetical protein
VRYISPHAGWRLYMEDAHICATLSDKKSYLFAVFDGHGGNHLLIKALRCLPSSSGTSSMSLNETRTSRIRITRWLSNRRSLKWMSCFSLPRARNRSQISNFKCVRKRMLLITKKIHTLDALQMSVSSRLTSSFAPMLVIPGRSAAPSRAKRRN